MQLWVGLGNPGPQYALNRHNVGFMAADIIAELHNFTAPSRKFQGWASEGRIGSEKLLLLKPATFMNESGRAVGEAMRFYKLEPQFRRVRIGIGHPGHKDRVHGYVLGNYAKAEMDPLSDMLGAIGAESHWLAEGDDVRFMNDVAVRLAD